MIGDVPNELMGNDMFQDFIRKMVEDIHLKVNNDLKLGEITIDDEIVKATWFSMISNRQTFEMMKTFNLVLNGADADAFGNVNKFISNIETIYLDGETQRDEYL